MVTLSVYFEYKKVLCKIFIKYIVAILQVNPNYFIILHKIIKNDISLKLKNNIILFHNK